MLGARARVSEHRDTASRLSTAIAVLLLTSLDPVNAWAQHHRRGHRHHRPHERRDDAPVQVSVSQTATPPTSAAQVTPPNTALSTDSITVPTVTTAGARAAFGRGDAALHASPPRYDEASEAFHEAVRLEPTPGTWRWLGVTLRSMERYTEALDAFEHFVAAPGPGTTPEQLVEARQIEAEMRRLLARLTITVQPSRATLLVNGRPRTMSPAGLALDPGNHVVELRAEGFAAVRREVTLARGGVVELNLRLDELPGRIIVEPSVANAEVTIDHLAVGNGRTEREAARGEHLIEIRATDYEPLRRVAQVPRGGVVRVDATLVRRRLPGWVVPVAIAGSVLIAGSVAAAIVVASQPEDPTPAHPWGTITP